MEDACFADFNSRLLVELPVLRPVYEEHIEDNDSVLEIVLMDQYSRFVIEHAAAAFSNKEEDGVFADFVAVLEKELAHDRDDFAVLLRTTFCETVDTYWRQSDFHAWMLSKIGPQLKKGLSIT